MARNHESGWGMSSPESGSDSSSASSTGKESKGSKSSEPVRIERTERPAPPQAFAQFFGREVLKPGVGQEGVIPLRAAEDKPSESKEKNESPAGEEAAMPEQPVEEVATEPEDATTVAQEREIAAEAVDEAQAHNEAEASQADNAVAQASAENVGQLLGNMEAGLETAPPEETAEQIIDRTTEETAASLSPEQMPQAEVQPLDWPQYQHEAQSEQPEAETGAGEQATNYAEAANVPAMQPEQLHQQAHENDPDQAYAAPYAAPGGGQGRGGQRPPHAFTVEHNPNDMPPAGPAVPAAANVVGIRARAHEINAAFWDGFIGGLIGGGIIGHWLGHRHERTRARRAMTKQERTHQEQLTRYESQVADSEARIRKLTQERTQAAREATLATAETVPPVAPAAGRAEVAAAAPLAEAPVPERPVVAAPAAAEALPAESRGATVKTGLPKRVEMMTDAEVHEASRDVKIGDKTLYELKENGTVTTADERTLLHLVEQGGIEDPARKYRFDQEVRRVLMRHELDPLLAQQVLQHDQEAAPTGQGALSASAQPYSPLFEPLSSQAHNPTAPVTTPAANRPDRAQASRPLVIANVVALGILMGLLLVLLIVSITR